MPRWQDELTRTTQRVSENNTVSISRRRMLQVGGAGVLLGAVSPITTAAESDGSSGPGIRHERYPGPLGGGDGVPSDLVYSASEADIVVTNGDVNAALNSASSGDVIYIQGSAGGFTADVANVTIAGNRGIGSDGRIRGAITVAANNVEFTGLSIDRGSRSSTAITINARGATFTNCLVENAGGARGAIRYPITNSGTTWRQCRFQNFSFYGHQIAYNWHDENNKIVFEYCDFNNLGQHMISGGYGWFHLRDNHFRGRLEHRHDHVIEVRGTGGAPVSCGTRCGNAIVEHNLCEARGSSGAAGLVRVRGVPTQGVWISNNVAPACSESTGGCESNGSHGGWRDQLVMQNAASSGEFDEVHISNNRL